MPILTGKITPGGGAVIDVFVCVSQARQRLLVKHGFRVPEPIGMRAIIDTGADISGVAPQVFPALELTPVARIDLFTPSTPMDQPHQSDLYDVELLLVANGATHPFPSVRVVAADCWHPEHQVLALIGRDILDHCFFEYHGPNQQFRLSF